MRLKALLQSRAGRELFSCLTQVSRAPRVTLHLPCAGLAFGLPSTVVSKGDETNGRGGSKFKILPLLVAENVGLFKRTDDSWALTFANNSCTHKLNK